MDINDAPNRATLTKGPVQQEIHRDTGAGVSTKGVWYPKREDYRPGDEEPLYLEVTAPTREAVRHGVEAVRAVMNREPEPAPSARPSGRRPEAKVTVDIESRQRWFNVRSKVVGPGGMFVKYIQEETGTRVQVKGLGSGYVEYNTGAEADEPMHIHIVGPDPSRVQEAKELAEDLMEVVREEYAKTKAFYEGGAPPQAADGGHGGYGSRTGSTPSASAAATSNPPIHLGGGDSRAAAVRVQRDPSPARAEPAQVKTAEQETIDKYWRDYISWEKSFIEYHSREPRPDEGKQQVPPEYM